MLYRTQTQNKVRQNKFGALREITLNWYQSQIAMLVPLLPISTATHYRTRSQRRGDSDGAAACYRNVQGSWLSVGKKVLAMASGGGCLPVVFRTLVCGGPAIGKCGL